jgi:hypothetical protein
MFRKAVTEFQPMQPGRCTRDVRGKDRLEKAVGYRANVKLFVTVRRRMTGQTNTFEV